MAAEVGRCGITSSRNMAAFGAHGSLEETVVSAEELCEYVQVVVEDSEEVIVEQGAAANVSTLVPSEAVSEEVIRSLRESNMVYYMQSDGTLVQGGELGQQVHEVTWLQHPSTQESSPEQAAVSVGHPPPQAMVKTATQQLLTAAQHVALQQGNVTPVTRLVSPKGLKTFRIEVPGLQLNEDKTQGLGLLHGAQKPAVQSKIGSGSPSPAGAQIIRIKPQSVQRQFLLQSSESVSPAQVIVKKPSLSLEKVVTGVSSLKTVYPTDLVRKQAYGASLKKTHPVARAEASSAPNKSSKKEQKTKRSVKVKTRSGRISRPPMHKVKDYKFIKMGDLAYSHPSDSDDYAELSADEEEDWAKGSSLAVPQSYTVKHTLFQCDTCEKSYMGKGGLLRHYRLHPGHGQLALSDYKEATKAGGALRSTAEPVTSEQQRAASGAEQRLCGDSQDPSGSSLSSTVQATAERKNQKGTRRGRPRGTGRRFGRPRKTLAGGSADPKTLNKARLKELLQLCDKEDLKELVLPCLTKLITVYEFLLLKVEQDYPQKPRFPSVYKEFERLHSSVKILAQDYFRIQSVNAEKILAVNDHKVAVSLGVSEEMIGKDNSAVCSSPATNEQEVNVNVKAKRKHECSEEELPPLKKQRQEVSDSVCCDQNGNNVPPVTCEEKRLNEGLGCQVDNLYMPGGDVVAINTSPVTTGGLTGEFSQSEAHLPSTAIESGSELIPYEMDTGLSTASQSLSDAQPAASSGHSQTGPEGSLTEKSHYEGQFSLEDVKMSADNSEDVGCLFFSCITETSALDQNGTSATHEVSFDDGGHLGSLDSHSTEPRSTNGNKSEVIDPVDTACADVSQAPSPHCSSFPTQASSPDGKCDALNDQSTASHGVNSEDTLVLIQSPGGMVSEDTPSLLLKSTDASGLQFEIMEALFQI
ncbi:zinc finger protein 839 [Spea bombifrons]|uniref:zinc finger protein 839 n=1 Tax=Spea bombifrons TaxID=233779 RepID=UPI00234B5B8A|nr:zinc finger protein 839 [Spea bombifrons]